MKASGDKLKPNATTQQQWDAWKQEKTDEASLRHLDIADLNPRNWGVHQGRPQIIDPGSVEARPSFSGGFNPLVDTSKQPGTLSSAILGLLGSDKAMQESLAQGRNAVSYQPAVEAIGSTLGGLAGGGLAGSTWGIR